MGVNSTHHALEIEGHRYKLRLICKWRIETQESEKSISFHIRYKGVKPVCQATCDFRCEILLLDKPLTGCQLFDTATVLSSGWRLLVWKVVVHPTN
jgi:hypothetical protein